MAPKPQYVSRKFIDLTRGATSNWANWDPPKEIKVGDYGMINNETGEFEWEGNLYNLDYKTQSEINTNMMDPALLPKGPEGGDDLFIVRSWGTIIAKQVPVFAEAALPGAANAVFKVDFQFEGGKPAAALVMYKPRYISLPNDERIIMMLKSRPDVLEGKYIVTQVITCAAYVMYMSDQKAEKFSVTLQATAPAVNAGRAASFTWSPVNTHGLYREGSDSDTTYKPLYRLKKTPSRFWLPALGHRGGVKKENLIDKLMLSQTVPHITVSSPASGGGSLTPQKSPPSTVPSAGATSVATASGACITPNSNLDTPEIPPETKEARDPRGPEHEESDEDVDSLDKQQGCNDPQPSFVPDACELVSAATLQDLTEFITKTGDYPVAHGGFGEIWKCTYRTDRGPIAVAVKSLLVYASDQLGGAMEKKTRVGTSMKVCLLITPSVLQRIHREIRTCARLKHHNILSVYGYTYGFGLFMAIVSPWAENGDLTTYLEREDAHLTMVRRFQILRDIIDGLHYLHLNNVIHGDLTGPNVLIHGDGTACLADFGLSLVYSEVMSTSLAPWTSTFHGNFRWLAPELLGEPDNALPIRPSKCSDVYSFGGIMLQVLTSRPPYYYLSEAAVIQRIASGVKPLQSRYPALSDKYWHLIEECWSAAPQDRPLAERVVRVIADEQDLLARS